MTLRRLAFFLFFLLSWSGFAKDNYSITRTHFLPPEYYVGDRVEVRVRLSVEPGLSVAGPSELPAPDSVHIQDVRIIPISGEYDVRITFASYDTGSRELPPLKLGDIVLTGVLIDVESILQEGDTTISGAFGPMLLPGTRVFLALLIGALLIVVPLAVVVVIGLRRLFRGLRVKWKERKPLKDLNNGLDTLTASKVNSRDFYIELTTVFRGYLTGRLAVETNSHTTSELARYLRELFEGVEAVERISTDLSRFDEAKFGTLRVKRQQRNMDIKKVRDAALAIEEWKQEEHNHVDA